MKRGFIYSSSGPRGSNQKGDAGSSNPERQRPSLRKRQRSPDSSVTNLPGPSRQRQSTAVEEGEDFLLDELGSAALEQYELTQRQRSPTPSPIPKPQSPFSITTTTATYTVPHSTSSLPQAGTSSTTTSTHGANPVANKTQKWPSPYQSAVGLRPFEAPVTHNQPSSSAARVAQSQEQLLPVQPGHTSALQVAGSNGESKELAGRIREIQEQNFTKDGEVKVLRSEKERLLEELRKRDRQLHDVTSRMQLEKRTREEQLLKESESLATQLKFSAQELKALQEKCTFLEHQQRASTHSSSQQTPPLPLSRPPQKSFGGSDSVARKGRAQAPGKDRPADFLSTETFMPLSQMAQSDVTAVHIGQKRGSQNEQGSGGGTALKAKSAKKISSVSLTTVATTKKQDKGPSSMPVDVNSISLSPSSGSRRTPARLTAARGIVRKDTKLLPTATRTFHSKDPPIVLDVPGIQLDGAGLLRLLVDPNLLKLPEFEFRSEDSAPWEEELPSSQSLVCEEYSTSELSPVVRAPPRKLIGLLSLLHPPVQTSPFPVVFPNMLMTPVSSHKSSEPGSSSSTDGSYRWIPTFEPIDTTPRTPVRKQKIPLPKPHTCARSDLSKAKTREAFGASKSLSASTTPVRLPPPDQQSVSSLASSINTAGLEQSIASLLRSTDSSQLSAIVSHWSLSGASPSPFGLSYSGDSCSLLLQHLGEIVIEYYNEQQSKARASASAGNASELGETLDSSANSPKSSLSSSTVSSRDLVSPPAADQELVSQMLGLLETLVCYSRSAREQLLTRPPEFSIDSRPSSAMDHRSFLHSDEEEMEEWSDLRREVVASVAPSAASGRVESLETLQV